MTVLKTFAIIWAVLYAVSVPFVFFTVSQRDMPWVFPYIVAVFWAPLPITIVARWRPRIAGYALFTCVALGALFMLGLMVTPGVEGWRSILGLLTFLLISGVPHMLFGSGYLLLARRATAATMTVPIEQQQLRSPENGII